MIDRAARSQCLLPPGERGAGFRAMSDTPSRWSSLREILRYVPRFRDRVFVIALHGAVVEDDNFSTLLQDIALLRSLRIGVVLANDIVPVIPPLGDDGEGNTYRLNSDHVAVEVARALEAVKLIYLTTSPGVMRNSTLLRHLSVEEAEGILKKSRAEVAPETVSKLEQAVQAAQGGVPRVHIIDGRVEEGLLAEVFSNQGIGTLIHANEYKAIRRA